MHVVILLQRARQRCDSCLSLDLDPSNENENECGSCIYEWTRSRPTYATCLKLKLISVFIYNGTYFLVPQRYF
jgi:hypothetical protein